MIRHWRPFAESTEHKGVPGGRLGGLFDVAAVVNQCFLRFALLVARERVWVGCVGVGTIFVISTSLVISLSFLFLLYQVAIFVGDIATAMWAGGGF